MNYKRIVYIMVPLLFTIASLFSETITIEETELQQIIEEEVSKKISTAIDEAVSIAIKEIEIKYISIVAEKDKEIIDKQLEIDTLTIQKSLLDAQKTNLLIEYNLYKSNHGFFRDFTIGGISLVVGVACGIGIYFLIPK